MSAMKPSGIKSHDSKYPALSKSHRVQGISLSRLRHMCDLCIGAVKHENVDDDAEFQPEMPAGKALTHINADKKVALKNQGEVALKFYNDTKSKNFKLVKVCKVNSVAGRYSGVTFRAQEDGSEESPLFRGVVFGMLRPEPLFCEIKEDDEVTLLPDDDDYASPERACEIVDFHPSICAVEPDYKKSDDDSKYPEEMSAVENKGIKSYNDSEDYDEMSAMVYNSIKSYHESMIQSILKI